MVECFRLLGIDYIYSVLSMQAQEQNPSAAYLECYLDQQLYRYILRINLSRLHVVFLVNSLEYKMVDK